MASTRLSVLQEVLFLLLGNFTYAVFDREILKQPSGIAFQIGDAAQAKWLQTEEYADNVETNIRADTIDALADKLVPKGLKDEEQFLTTIMKYNNAVDAFNAKNTRRTFDPSIRDGMSTQSSKAQLQPGKINWETLCKKGPFTAVQVTTGITFTFGGLAVQPQTGAVLWSLLENPLMDCTVQARSWKVSSGTTTPAAVD